MNCIECGKLLLGRQSKYCSKRCEKNNWKRRNPEKHKEYMRVSAAAKRKHNRDYVLSLKNKPCIDCGNSYPPYVMDFDHVNGTKIKAISQIVQGSFVMLVTELAKCELVCSNCHRIRTFQRRYNL